MKELIKKAFKLNKVERLKCKGKIYELEQVYAPIDNVWYDKNGLMVFTYKGDNYITPYNTEDVITLENNGFMRKAMYVAFSDNAIPIDRLNEYESKIRMIA